MSEILKERLRKSIGKIVKLFLFNDFRYEGEITGVDDDYLEILDFKSNSFKIIVLSQIKDMEIKKNGMF